MDGPQRHQRTGSTAMIDERFEEWKARLKVRLKASPGFGVRSKLMQSRGAAQ